MKNAERKKLKEEAMPRKARLRMVLGPRACYELYLRNFLYNPATARRLERPTMLDGLSPERVLVVLLPGWREEARGTPGLFSRFMEWRSRWAWLGFEEVEGLELEGGIPVRQGNLLKKYDSLLDSCGSNSIAIESAKDWLKRLDDRDSFLLLKAVNERKKALVEVAEKSLNLPLCDERL
jgi:hypothetical protein